MTAAITEALSHVRHIICHGNCSDGLASAMLLAHALPEAEVTFVSYGPELEGLAPRPGMLFCDIAPATERDTDGRMTEEGRAMVRAFVAHGAIVLDHHKSARDVVAMFGDRGMFGDEAAEPGVSGAVLACREVWQRLWENTALDVVDFARRAGIRDTWQTTSPEWNAACAQHEALMFYGADHFLRAPFDPHPPYLLGYEIELGRILYHRRSDAATKAAQRVQRVGQVALYNDAVPSDGRPLVSDLGEACRALPDPPALLVAYHYAVGADGVLRFHVSLRRCRDDVDCAAIARANGGGGHTGAAGFAVTIERGHLTFCPERYISDALQLVGPRYEALLEDA